MMNLCLNLLPPRKKKILLSAVNFLFAKNMLELIIFFATITTTALVWSWMVAQNEFIDVASGTVLVEREYYTYNQDIKNANTVIRDIHLTSRGFYLLTPKIIELISSLPDDIKLNSVQIDRQTKTLTIGGTALTRSALLNYADTLKKIPWLGSIETPASQLFQKNNINFEFKTALKGFPELSDSKTNNKTRTPAEN